MFMHESAMNVGSSADVLDVLRCSGNHPQAGDFPLAIVLELWLRDIFGKDKVIKGNQYMFYIYWFVLTCVQMRGFQTELHSHTLLKSKPK